MRHKIGPSDKRVRPANIPPRFTPPAQLYPSPGLRRHLPRFQSFWDSFMWDSLQLKRDKAWALHTYDMESKSGRERGWKRQRRGEKREEQRERDRRRWRGQERENEKGGKQKARGSWGRDGWKVWAEWVMRCRLHTRYIHSFSLSHSW